MKIKTLFRILLTPSCWIRNHKTNNALSTFINNALDNGYAIVIIDRFTVMLNEVELWVGNYPHAFGWDYVYRKTYGVCPGMPDRATVFRLYDELQKIKGK